MANGLIVDIITHFRGKKQLSDADKQIVKLSNSVKNLAAGFGIAFGARALSQYSKQAVMAFAADDKAAQQLTRTLKNLGLSYADVTTASFIHSLEQQYGVVDDLLRPAMQKLLTTTGNVTQAQSLLKTALDLSAASGSDVLSVASDLSKGYVGQTRALAKYGLGLSQTQLKAMKFEEVQNKINTLFSGQAQLAADTYAGKIDRLNVAAKNASETIGKGLVEAIGKFGGGGTKGIDNVITAMNTLAKIASGVANTFADVAQAIMNPVGFFRQNTKTKNYISGSVGGALSQGAKIDQQKADALAKKRAAAALAAERAKAKALKDQATLKKLSGIFDLQQIGIIAALKGKVSDEERTRLQLQLALITGNADEATALAKKLAEAQSDSEALATFLKTLPDAKNPFEAWKTFLDGIQKQAADIAAMSMNPDKNPVPTGNSWFDRNLNPNEFGAGRNAQTPDVTINFNGTVADANAAADQMRQALIDAYGSGKTSWFDRNLGTFG